MLVTPLTREDVEGVYAGLRPLLAGESESTSQAVPRAHGRAPGARAGGRGRRQVHDVPGDGQGRGRRGRATASTTRCRDCVTDRIPLVGAEGYAALWNAPAPAGRPGTGCTSRGSSTCCTGYGSLLHEVLALIDGDPSLGEPLEGADDYLRAEVVYAASHEGARHLDDVLTRRTRISIETFDRGVTRGAESPPSLMAPVLGWSAAQIEREVEHYLARVEAERQSQEQPDDQTADAARLGAPEIVPLA